MSVLVELEPELYDKAAFDGFTVTAPFSLANARALMWFSQLAYETGKPNTIAHAQALWGFKSITPVVRGAIKFRNIFSTRMIIGERDDVTLVAFCGTDPGVWQNIATDLNTRPSPNTGVHAGFERAFAGIMADLAPLLTARTKPIMFTGHSLGGALAVLASQHARQAGVTPLATYTFGQPRVGGTAFAQGYRPALSATTYRLVHGHDIVPSLPMSGLGYCHSGFMLACGTGEKFDLKKVSTDDLGDLPAFLQSIVESTSYRIRSWLSGHILTAPGLGWRAPFVRLLTPAIRDHLPDRYLHALTP